MRTIRDHILVAVNESQKSDYEIEFANGTKLWMNSSFGTDRKVTQPVVALVIGVGPNITDLQAGDAVLCHHNAFSRMVSENAVYGRTGQKTPEGLMIFRLEASMVYFKLTADGEAVPLKGYMTVSRIEEKLDTLLEVPDSAKKTYKNRFKVLAVGPECGGIDPGNIVVTYTHSDYEMIYTYKNKPRRVIRVKYDQVLSLCVDM